MRAGCVPSRLAGKVRSPPRSEFQKSGYRTEGAARHALGFGTAWRYGRPAWPGYSSTPDKVYKGLRPLSELTRKPWRHCAPIMVRWHNWMTEVPNSTIPLLALAVAFLALAVSALTAWLTLLRKGTILMTRPTVIYFGPDGRSVVETLPKKVYLRTLLYSTGKRGHIIENMFVRVQRGETRQNFNVWTYGDKNLSRGSGLFIPETGLATNHHFLLPPDGTTFQFSIGQYVLEIFVTEVGARAPRLLHTVNLEIQPETFKALNQPGHGLYFDWGPDAGRYFAHVRPPSQTGPPDFLRDMLADEGE